MNPFTRQVRQALELARARAPGFFERTCRESVNVEKSVSCPLKRPRTWDSGPQRHHDQTVLARVRPDHPTVHLISEQLNNYQTMKSILTRYKHVTALLGVILLAVAFYNLGVPFAHCVGLIAVWQISQLAMSRRTQCCYIAALSDEQAKEFEDIIARCGEQVGKFASVSAKTANLEKRYDELLGEVRKLRRIGLGGSQNGVRWVGNVPFVTDDCATALTSVFVLDCAKVKGALDLIVRDETTKQRVIGFAASTLGLETRAALSPTEIPLPTIYVPQIVELVFRYGQARQYATVFPLGAGTVKLPRLKAGEDDFGYLGAGTAGMSQAIPEKKVTAELVTFEANKFGGLIRIPYELEEDTFVPIGQFLARYIARQLAKGEDKAMFLADGTAAYASQTGVGPYCAANPDYLVQLAAGKTLVTDVALDDLRNMRGLVNDAVLSNMAANGQTSAAYYMSPSMEPVLRGFNKYPNFIVFTKENGQAMFDGWPVRWIGVSARNNGQAQPGAYAAFFGDLSYWYLGERGTVRVEVSKEVFFSTDELAMRALERIDVEALAIDAMSALQLAAA